MNVNHDILTQMAAMLAALQRQVQTLHEAVRAQTELLVLLHPGNGEIPLNEPPPDDNDDDEDNGEDDAPEIPPEEPSVEA
jgi:hypothetical protein